MERYEFEIYKQTISVMLHNELLYSKILTIGLSICKLVCACSNMLLHFELKYVNNLVVYSFFWFVTTLLALLPS